MVEPSKFDVEIVDQFDKTAENYSQDSLFSHGYDLDIILKQAHPNPTTIVLDVATGAGHVAMRLLLLPKKYMQLTLLLR